MSAQKIRCKKAICKGDLRCFLDSATEKGKRVQDDFITRLTAPGYYWPVATKANNLATP